MEVLRFTLLHLIAKEQKMKRNVNYAKIDEIVAILIF